MSSLHCILNNLLLYASVPKICFLSLHTCTFILFSAHHYPSASPVYLVPTLLTQNFSEGQQAWACYFSSRYFMETLPC